MEIYVMKKKFVLTLALVLMVAVTLSAATPVEVSGNFKAGYKLTFDPFKVAQNDLSGANQAQTAKIAVSGDFWKVSLNAVNFTNAKDIKATADIYLDKALAAEGVDMGDVGLTLHIGSGVSADAPSVFADKGGLSSGLSAAGANLGLSIGYADLVDVYFAADLTADPVDMVIGATVDPVDGVNVAVGYTNSGNGITGSAKADIAKLADLDFALAVTLEDIYLVDAKTNELNVDVATTIEGIGLYAAYQMDAAKKHNMKIGASYTLSGVGLSASFKMVDLGNAKTMTVGGGANYKFGGVKYALDAEYTKAAGFSLSPSVSIAF